MAVPSLAALVLLGATAGLARAGCDKTAAELIDLMTASPYSRLQRPDSNGPFTEVATQLYVESLNAVDEKANMVEMSGYWRVAWTDQRLNFTSVDDGGCFDKLTLPLQGDRTVPLKSPKAWVPDLYFTSALKESYGSSFFELYPSGSVYMSVRFKHSFKCIMDFSQMPFDSQLCSIEMMSYSEDATEVQLAAKDGIGIVLQEGGVYLPSWAVEKTDMRFEMLQYGTGDEATRWHAMKLDVAIKRSSRYHIMNDVLYGILFVAMSWTGFFVNRTNAPARVALSLLPVLTMLNHITGIQSQLPRISDMTWLSTFLLVSLIYNILAVLEYGLVSWLLSVEDERAARLRTLRALSLHLGEAYVTQSLSRIRMSTMSSMSGAIPAVPSPRTVQDESPAASPESTLEMGRSLSEDLDVSSLLPMQQRMVQESMRLFVDPKGEGHVSRKMMRSGLRYFDIYYTAEQVTEIFAKMGVEDNEDMPRRRFMKFLKSMPEPTPTMSHGFVDKPPSMIVDQVMRYVFVITYIGALLAFFPLVGAYAGTAFPPPAP